MTYFFVCGLKVFLTEEDAQKHARYWKAQHIDIPVYRAKVVSERLN